MKKLYRAFALFLAIFSMCFLPIHASEPVQQEMSMADRIRSLISKPIAPNQTVSYVVIDKSGNDISELFEASLISCHNVANTSFIDATVIDLDDISSFEKITESKVTTYNSDIAKSKAVEVVKEITQKLPDFYPNTEITAHVEYTLTGTIYYNPNTYKISQTFGPLRSKMICFQVNTNNDEFNITTSNVNKGATIASNKLSATFYFNNKIIGKSVTGAYSTVVFGDADTSFTISAD